MQSVVERRGAGSPSTTSTAIFTATFTGDQVSAFTLIWVNQTPERLFWKYQSYSGRSKTLNNWWSLNTIPDQHGDQIETKLVHMCQVDLHIQSHRPLWCVRQYKRWAFPIQLYSTQLFPSTLLNCTQFNSTLYDSSTLSWCTNAAVNLLLCWVPP